MSTARRVCVLTDRDHKILWTVLAFAGVARTSELTKLFFGSKYTCLHRLKALRSAGLLELARQAGVGRMQEHAYRVTSAGRRAVAERYDLPLDALPSGKVSLAEHAHAFALNGLRVELVTALRSWGRHRIASWQSFWDLRVGDRAVAGQLLPDALVAIDQVGDIRGPRWAVEVDFSTESLRVLAAKVEQYGRWLDADGAGYQVVFLAPSWRRARSLAGISARAWWAANCFVGVTSEVTSPDVLHRGLVPARSLASESPSTASGRWAGASVGLLCEPVTGVGALSGRGNEPRQGLPGPQSRNPSRPRTY